MDPALASVFQQLVSQTMPGPPGPINYLAYLQGVVVIVMMSIAMMVLSEIRAAKLFWAAALVVGLSVLAIRYTDDKVDHDRMVAEYIAEIAELRSSYGPCNRFFAGVRNGGMKTISAENFKLVSDRCGSAAFDIALNAPEASLTIIGIGPEGWLAQPKNRGR